MKKIFSIMIILLLAISAVAAQDIELDKDQQKRARDADSMKMCMRYLQSEYPDASRSRVEETCERLREGVRTRIETRERIRIDDDDEVRIRQEVRTEIRSRFDDMDEEQRRRLMVLSDTSQQKIDDLPLELRQRLAALDDEQKEKIKVLTRARIRELAQEGEFEERIKQIKVREFNDKSEIFKKRTVRNEVEFRARFNQLQNNYGQLVSSLNARRDRFQEAVSEGDESGAIDAAKNYLTTLADTIINTLERIKTNVEANDDLSEAEVDDIVDRINKQISTVETAKADVENAATKDEVKEAGKTIIEIWRTTRPRIEGYVVSLVKAQIFDTYRRAEFMEKKLDQALLRLDEEGYDTGEIEELVEDYSKHIQSAKESYDEAKELIKEGRESEDEELIEEGKELIEDAHEELKEANEILKEIIMEIREAAGTVDYIVEADVEYAIEEDDEMGLQEVEVEFYGDGTAKVEIEFDGEKEEITLDADSEEAVYAYIMENYEVTSEEIDAVIEIEFDDDQDEDSDKESDEQESEDDLGLTEVEVEFYADGTAKIEVEYMDQKSEEILSATSEDEVYDYLLANYNVTRDNIDAVIEIEYEDEQEDDDSKEQESDEQESADKGLTEAEVTFNADGTAQIEIEYNEQTSIVSISASTVDDVYAYLVDNYNFTTQEAMLIVEVESTVTV